MREVPVSIVALAPPVAIALPLTFIAVTETYVHLSRMKEALFWLASIY